MTTQSLRYKITGQIQLLTPLLVLGLFSILSLGPVQVLAQSAGALTPPTYDPLKATGHFVVEKVEKGGTADLEIQLELEAGYHAYTERFKLVPEFPDGLKVDKLRVSPVVQFKDMTAGGALKEGIEKTAKLKTVVEVTSDVNITGSNPNEAQFALTYQACTAQHCLFPKTIHFRVPLQVIAAPPAAGSTSPSGVSVATSIKEDDFTRAFKKGLVSALLFMFVAGFLTSLTPCVYPMIPITLAVFGAREKHISHLHGFLLSLVFVLGMAVNYSALGVLAASTGALFGSVMSNPYLLTVVAIWFILMALSMFGVIEFRAPDFILDRIAKNHAHRGYWGAFTTGLITGVVASPCVGPVLFSVLAFIAETRDLLLGFMLLFSFSLGMGILFLVLGTFSQMISKIPRAGKWMNVVKYFFGTVMLLVACYYLSLTPWGQKIRASFRPTTITVEQKKLHWEYYSDAKLAEALAGHKPVIMDFTAEWCGACTELEEKTYSDSKVASLAEQFVLLKFDATNDSPELETLKNKYGILGLPTVLFFSKSGTWEQSLTLTGFEGPAEFLARMQRAK